MAHTAGPVSYETESVEYVVTVRFTDAPRYKTRRGEVVELESGRFGFTNDDGWLGVALRGHRLNADGSRRVDTLAMVNFYVSSEWSSRHDPVPTWLRDFARHIRLW